MVPGHYLHLEKSAGRLRGSALTNVFCFIFVILAQVTQVDYLTHLHFTNMMGISFNQSHFLQEHKTSPSISIDNLDIFIAWSVHRHFEVPGPLLLNADLETPLQWDILFASFRIQSKAPSSAIQIAWLQSTFCILAETSDSQ